MRLHNLRAPEGANVRRTRVGRGESSGLGKTSGKGGKGQTARTGKGKPRPGFEGGQTPMYRRMPKRGFNNIFAKKWAEINLDVLAKYFPTKQDVTLASLQEAGLAPRNVDGLRVLGRGELKVGLSITADHFSGSAKQKIEAAGGKANVKAPNAASAAKA